MPSQDPAAPGDNLPTFSVSEISGAVKRALEDGFAYVRVRGELSGFKRHSSGHVYCTLKDANAALDGVCWRSKQRGIRFKPVDGMEVVCTGRLTTNPRSSRYQLDIDSMAPAGVGALMALLEERKKALAAEGLFAPERKRQLPFLPETIGVITSPTGAVLRDILHRLRERFPRRVLLWPVRVQGDSAAEEVAAAIAGFNALAPGGQVPRPDVLIVARGGGSIEDLWAFNEEIVVRAAATSAIPVISAVGHETDTTLIDFAADRRAPTPTAAAELAVPVREELTLRVRGLDERLVRGMRRELTELGRFVRDLARGLPRPESLLGQAAQRLDDRGERLPAAFRAGLGDRRLRLAAAAQRLPTPDAYLRRKAQELGNAGIRLAYLVPAHLRARRGDLERARLGLRAVPLADRTRRARLDVDRAAGRLGEAARRRLSDASARVAGLDRLLDSFSYRAVLARGFALVRDGAGTPLRAAAAARRAGRLEIEFADGRVPVRAEPAPERPGRRGEETPAGPQPRLL